MIPKLWLTFEHLYKKSVIDKIYLRITIAWQETLWHSYEVSTDDKALNLEAWLLKWFWNDVSLFSGQCNTVEVLMDSCYLRIFFLLIVTENSLKCQFVTFSSLFRCFYSFKNTLFDCLLRKYKYLSIYSDKL